jgi:hypothetical protein
MLYMMMTSPLIPRAEALGNYARPGIHRHSRESGNPCVMKMDPALRIIAHGFSHGKTGLKPWAVMLKPWAVMPKPWAGMPKEPPVTCNL